MLLAWWVLGPTYLPIFSDVFLGASMCAAAAGFLLVIAWAVAGPLTRGNDDDERGSELAGLIVRISLYVLAGIALGFLLGAVIPWLARGNWIPAGDLGRAAIQAACYWTALLAGGALSCGLLLSVRDRRHAA